VAVFPVQDDELRGALFAERAARLRAEQTVAEQAKELQRFAVEMHTFTVLRDNFHELYSQERDARRAAERVAADCLAERERTQDELHKLRSDNAQLRTALIRAERPRPTPVATERPEREVRGVAQVDWMPRLVEDR
jgi:hypothetical protein